MKKKKLKRCPWPENSFLMLEYHDREWGVPEYNDRKLFEFLILEGAQAGLSWNTVLNKRENYRKAFDKFDPEKIVRYGGKKVKSLPADTGIIRNRLKIQAAVNNAQRFLDVQISSLFSALSCISCPAQRDLLSCLKRNYAQN